MKKFIVLTTFFIANTANAGFLDNLGKVLNTTGAVLDVATGTTNPATNQAVASKFNVSNSLVDIANFDISGVKLGMNPTEVMQIVKNRFPNAKINTYTFKSPFDNRIELINRIEVKSKNESLNIHFGTTALNGEINKPLVKFIKYSIPDEQSNWQNLEQAAIEKYGKPTINYSWQYQWCQNPTKYGCLSAKEPVLYLQHIKNFASISSGDPAYNLAESQAISKTKVVKPNI